MIRAVLAAASVGVVLAGPAASSSITDIFSSLMIFGDSLSDNGNLFRETGLIADATPDPTDGPVPPPPYFNGRFSDGPVWNEGLLAEFGAAGKPAANFAFGGAKATPDADGIPDFQDQIGLYALSGLPAVAGDEALASLLYGGNDLFRALDTLGTAGVIATAQAAAQSIGAGIAALSTLGIDHFAVWNLADVGKTPAYALFDTANQADATVGTLAFNSALDMVVDSLQAGGLSVRTVDFFGLVEREYAAVEDGTSTFTDTTFPCLFPSVAEAIANGQPPLCDPTALAGKFYFDEVHPTEAAHRLLQAEFRATVVPLPGSGVLLAAALGLVALRRRGA